VSAIVIEGVRLSKHNEVEALVDETIARGRYYKEVFLEAFQ